MANSGLQLQLSIPLSNAMLTLRKTLAIISVHVFHKLDQLLFRKSDVSVHSGHKPLETIFKRPLATAPYRLRSMMLSLQYRENRENNFHVEY